MSWSVNVFVGPTVPLGEIRAELESMLGMELASTFENDEETFRLVSPSYLLILGTHDLIDDKGIPFETCPLQIALWATNVPDWETSSEECLRTATSIFETLKTSRRYRLLLVRNVQELLRAYSPTDV